MNRKVSVFIIVVLSLVFISIATAQTGFSTIAPVSGGGSGPNSSYLTVGPVSWDFSYDGTLKLKLENRVGGQINIKNIYSSIDSNIGKTCIVNISIPSGGQSDFITCETNLTGTSGSNYSIIVSIEYELMSSLGTYFNSTGTLSGTRSYESIYTSLYTDKYENYEGENVSVYLKNYDLNKNIVVNLIKITGENLDVVYGPISSQLLVQPNSTQQILVWDQKDNNGKQVPIGTYWAHAEFSTENRNYTSQYSFKIVSALERLQKSVSFVSASCTKPEYCTLAVDGCPDLITFTLKHMGTSDIKAGEMFAFLDGARITTTPDIEAYALPAGQTSVQFSYTAKDHKTNRTLTVSAPAADVSYILTCLPAPSECETDEDCMWCGTSCVKKDPSRVCVLITPPEGYECKCDQNICRAIGKTETAVTPATQPTTTAPPQSAQIDKTVLVTILIQIETLKTKFDNLKLASQGISNYYISVNDTQNSEKWNNVVALFSSGITNLDSIKDYIRSVKESPTQTDVIQIREKIRNVMLIVDSIVNVILSG